MPVTITLRRGTAEEWAAADPVLASGEPGLDTTGVLVKVGDGTTPWSELPAHPDGLAIGGRLAVLAARADVTADLSGWPLHLYGNSYTLLDAGWFTTGGHYAETVARDLGGGAVTSYGVGAERSLHTAYSLLAGACPGNLASAVPGARWPGAAARAGLVVLDILFNDIGRYPAMNTFPVVPAAIAAGDTRYLDAMEGVYRALLALVSSESRLEQTAGTFAGTWDSEVFPAPFHSAGSVAYTRSAGASWEMSVVPAQSGPLAGRVHAIVHTLDASVGSMAPVEITVDGNEPTTVTPPAWEQYTGDDGTAVNIALTALPFEVPVDGSAHTVRLTHAGSDGQYLYVDCLLVPSETPGPVALMGCERPPRTGAFTAAGVAAWSHNAPLLAARARDVVAEFAHAMYVPSTMTASGLFSGDGVHPNDRGQAQRAADLAGAVQSLKARLDAREGELAADDEFGVV